MVTLATSCSRKTVLKGNNLNATFQARLTHFAFFALVCALTLWAVIHGTTLPPKVPGPPAGGVSDLDLYREIADAVRSGQNYYTAAVEQQVKFDYPVTPASTVRLPTAAFVVAALGETGAYILLLGLLGIGVIGALFCFEKLTNSSRKSKRFNQKNKYG